MSLPEFWETRPASDRQGRIAALIVGGAILVWPMSRGAVTNRPDELSGCPFAHCEVRVPKAQGPEHNRDCVLNPAMERCDTVSRRRQMGRRSVDENSNQNVDPNEQASYAEKGFQELHLGSLPAMNIGAGINELLLYMRLIPLQ